MKKITDERLKVRNLKNLRIVFIVENLFLDGVLAWQLIQGKDIFAVLAWGNVPCAAVMIAGITAAVLSVNVSEPMADKPRLAVNRLVRRLVRQGVIVWAIAGVIFYVTIPDQPLGIHLALATGCGLLIALVWAGIDAYRNHFRDHDQDE
jgi:hypothetical protein